MFFELEAPRHSSSALDDRRSGASVQYAGVYRGGKYSNFEGGTRVPFVVRWPGRVKVDSASDTPFSQVDLFASLAALTGQKLAGNTAPDSFNELPAMLGISKQGRPYIVEHAGSLTIIEGDWKLIAPSEGPKMNQNTNTELGNDRAPQLYNLRNDPGERNNVAGEESGRVQKLTEFLNQVKAQSRIRK